MADRPFPTMRRIRATTSCEVHPAGLSTTITPLTGILLLSCRFKGGSVKSPATQSKLRELFPARRDRKAHP